MNQFLVKLAFPTNEEDIKRARMFFLPLVGVKAMMLLQLLFDELSLTRKMAKRELTLSYKQLALLSGLTEREVVESIDTLDRFSLLERYRRTRDDGTKTLLLLLTPKNLNLLRTEDQIVRRLTERVGSSRAKDIFEHVVKQLDLSKDLDEFEVGEDEEEKVEPLVPRLKPVGESSLDPNEEETARFLRDFRAKLVRIKPESRIDTISYIAQLSKRQPNKATRETIRLARESGFSDEALNIICQYAYRQNGKINLPFISTIITNFFRQGTIDSYDIKAHLDRASNVKRQRYINLQEERRRQRLLSGERIPDARETLDFALSNDPANQSLLHDPQPTSFKQVNRDSGNEEDSDLENNSGNNQRTRTKKSKEEDEVLKQEMISDILKNLKDKKRG